MHCKPLKYIWNKGCLKLFIACFCSSFWKQYIFYSVFFSVFCKPICKPICKPKSKTTCFLTFSHHLQNLHFSFTTRRKNSPFSGAIPGQSNIRPSLSITSLKPHRSRLSGLPVIEPVNLSVFLITSLTLAVSIRPFAC